MYRRLCLALALSLTACLSSGHSSQDPSLPSFAGKSIDGEYLSLQDFRGKVALVNVWATWCGPCKAEMPELVRLHRSYKDRGFSVVSINVDSPTQKKKALSYVKENALPFPVLLDPETRSTATFQVEGYPTSVLLGRDGRVQWRRSGLVRNKDPELLAAIEAALRKKTSPTPAE